jgi:poly [ADP-ribose] polymerase 2/3/4
MANSLTYTLNYFDPTLNSNKVWIGKALADGTFQTEYGRVREGSKLAQSIKKFESMARAIHELEKKKTEKLRKGYRETATLEEGKVVLSSSLPNLKEVATSQIEGCEDPTTRSLIEYLAQVNIHNICAATQITYQASSGTFRTPLGVLSPSAIAQARQLLKAIGNRAGDHSQLVRDYFQLVPHDFGMRVPPTYLLLTSDSDIQKEEAILDALEAVLQPHSSQADKVFECRLDKVPSTTEEGRATFRRIKKLFESTLNTHHSTSQLKPVRVYEVDIPSMRSAFEQKANKIGNIRRDLWHGTKASNLLSILKSGLFIPPTSAAQVTGRMFGDGLYFSIQSTKALNYATNFWNQSGNSNQRTFMFLCEVALGRTYKPRSSDESFPHPKTDSTWVEAGTAGVLNHECIVYETAQLNLKYLVEFN